MEPIKLDNLESYESIDSIDFGKTIVFIKFGTDWCKPCNQLNAVLSKIAGSIIYEVDVQNDEFENIMSVERIYNIPVTIIKVGKYKTKFTGLKTVDEIINIINNSQELTFKLSYPCVD